MSINSIPPHHHPHPWSGQGRFASVRPGGQEGSGGGQAGPPSAADAGGAARGGFGPPAPANPLRDLAADLQAILAQATGAAGSTGAGSTGAGSTGAGSTSTSAGTGNTSPPGGITATSTAPVAATPEQKLASDIQALMNQLQSSSGPANASGASGHHHHHHHHGDVAGAQGTSAASGASASASQAGGNQAGGNQAVSQVLAASIAQAIRRYTAAQITTATGAATGTPSVGT